jgi:uncharacterized OsmC-like protein
MDQLRSKIRLIERARAMQQIAVSTKVNGVDVDRLFETINAIKQLPRLADFKFRLRNRWINGGQNSSTIQNFYGADQIHQHKEPFVLKADEPKVLLGEDSAPNPVEYLMHALVTCVTTSLIYHAAAKGIRLDEVESRAEGEIDLRGFLGLDDTVRRGYKNLKIKFRIKADVPDEQLEELCQLGPTYSPVFDSVSRGVPVEVSLEK